MHRQMSYKPMPLAKEKLGKVHADLCIMPTTSFRGATCFACITDDATRYKWVLFLKSKGHFAYTFKGLVNTIENQSGHKMQCILTNGGGEFMSQSFKAWLQEKGISHEVTLAHSSEMNPIAERANRTLVETARAMLNEADLPKI
jgi:transposase InsO family protein